MHAHETTTPEFREAVARFAETLNTVAGNPAADNGDLPYLFHALQRQRWGIDHCGANWEQPLPARLSGQLASAHRKATAIDALAGLLMADFEARIAGDEEPRFTGCMTEGLFLALTELAGEMHNTLSVLGEQLERMPKGAAA